MLRRITLADALHLLQQGQSLTPYAILLEEQSLEDNKSQALREAGATSPTVHNKAPKKPPLLPEEE